MTLIKPSPWWPGLRRYDPLGDGLVAYWPMWEGAGSQVQDIVDPGGRLHGTINGATWVATDRGPVLNFNGTTDFVNINRAIFTDYPFTLTVRMRAPDITGIHVGISISDVGASNQQIFVGVHGGRAGDPAVVGVRGGSFSYAESTIAYQANKWHTVTAVCKSSTSRTVYLDGGNSGTNVNNEAASNWNVTDFGRLGDNSPTFTAQDIDFIVLHNRTLSAAEVKFLHDFLYALITPEPQVLSVAEVAAGNPWYQYAQEAAVAG